MNFKHALVGLAFVTSLVITHNSQADAKKSTKPIPATAQQRCGWYDNPTPSNFWLTDKEGEWTIGMQGMYQAEGIENMPDMSKRGWVITNGSSYGFGCACMTVDTISNEENNATITHIYKAKPMPIKSCTKKYGVEQRKLKNYRDEEE
jgi:hypothetical protein